MHDGLRSITFHLENCETITILRKWIGDFYLSGIDTIIERIGCNYIGKYKLAKKFAIEIFKGADKEKYAPFGIEGEETTKFKRLTTYADISQIELEFDDEEESYTYVINYQSTEEDSGLGSENINQTSKISTLGHLYIVIEEGKTVEDIFPDAIVENKEAVEFNMEMYDIGVDNEEEHLLNGDNLPKFYKYLQLSEKVKDIINYRTAIRVPDKESGWKFIYEPKQEDSLEEDEKIYLNYPDSWKYHEANIAKFLKKTHIENKDGFTPEELEKKYPRID